MALERISSMTEQQAPASIRRIAGSFSGVLGVAATNIKTGEQIVHNADIVFPTASMVKIGILLELFRQREAGILELDDMRTITKRDKVGGSGLIENMSAQVEMPLYNIAVLMNAISDNTATNVLIDHLGIASINRAMQDAGMTKTVLRAKIAFTSPGKIASPPFAVGTPRDFMTLMVNLHAGRLLNAKNTADMLAIMKIQKNMGNLTRYMLFNPYGKDDKSWVASKTGSVTGVRNETGLVSTKRGVHVISVMTKNGKDRKWTPDNEGTVTVAKVSKAVYDYFWG